MKATDTAANQMPRIRHPTASHRSCVMGRVCRWWPVLSSRMPTWRIHYCDGHTDDVTADWCEAHATGWTFHSVRWVVFSVRWVVDLRVGRDGLSRSSRCPDGVPYPPLDARSGHPRRVSYGRATVVMTSPVPVCHSNTTASVVGKMIVPATVLPASTGPMSMFAVLMSPGTTRSCALR